MVNEYKRIVLLKGLKCINDHHFSLFKSLLSSDLSLEKDKQEQYTIVQIADLMEEKFPADAGLGELIKFCEGLPALRKRAKVLKKERSKVIGETSLEINGQDAGPATPTSTTSNMTASERGESSTAQAETSTAQEGTTIAQSETSTTQKRKSMSKEETGVKKTKVSKEPDQPPCSEESTAKYQPPVPQILSSASSNIPLVKKERQQTTITEGGKTTKLTQRQAQLPETSGANIKKDEDYVQTPRKAPSTLPRNSSHKTPRRGIVPKEPAREEGHQQGPKQVMVLKVTDPFTYDMREDKRMFHATVATETEFFRVKVFDIALISKFIPRKIIFISDYIGCNGFLEIYRASCVSDVNVNPTMVVSNTLRQRANATPKISHLFSQAKGTFVNGEFVVIKKTEGNESICYGIEDSTGKMDVVVHGQFTNIKCEPGNKLRLVCFELTSNEGIWQLKSERHSYMKVI